MALGGRDLRWRLVGRGVLREGEEVVARVGVRVVAVVGRRGAVLVVPDDDLFAVEDEDACKLLLNQFLWGEVEPQGARDRIFE